MRRRIAAYLMLSIALAATVFCFVLLRGMSSDRIAGASPQRRYFALDIVAGNGTRIPLRSLVPITQLAQHLPHAFALAISSNNPPRFSRAELPEGTHQTAIALDTIGGAYFRAAAVRPLLGHLITATEERKHAPVAVINRRCAILLFGSMHAAMDREVVIHVGGGYSGGPLHRRVIGVIADGFDGFRAFDSRYAHGPVLWTPLLFPFGFETVLSVPTPVPAVAIRHDLDLAWHSLPTTVRQHAGQGLAFQQPFTIHPGAVAVATHKLQLYLVVAAAALLLTVVNLVAVNFLEARRRRAVYAIERILGATRGRQAWRALRGAVRGALLVVVVSGSLLVAAMVVTQRVLAASGEMLSNSPWGRIGRVLHVADVLIPALVLILAVILIELLVQAAHWAREPQAFGAERISSPRGEQRAGGAILAIEFMLAALLAVLAGWGVQYAWRMAHRDLGMLQGRPVSLVSTGYDMNRHGLVLPVANAVIAADLRHAIVGVVPHAQVGFGPVPGVRFRHTNGNFSTDAGHGVVLEHGEARILAQPFVASAKWLPLAEVQLLAGRDFRSGHADPHAILIDAEVARTLFGSVRAAVGQSVQLEAPVQNDDVIGVIAPLYLDGPGHAAVASYVSQLQGTAPAYRFSGGDIIVRPAVNAAASSAALQRAVARVFAKDDPEVEVSGVQSSDRWLGRLDHAQKELAAVFGAVAFFALLIALTGLVVFLRLFLAMRKRVDAIRSALGAGPRRQYTGVLLGTLALAVAGAVLALLFTPWLAQQFALLSGAQVAPYGWPTWIALAVLLLAVFLVAHFPARRAAHAEPAQSLHEL